MKRVIQNTQAPLLPISDALIYSWEEKTPSMSILEKRSLFSRSIESQNSGSRSTFPQVKPLTLNAELSNLKGSICKINMGCSPTEFFAFSNISRSFGFQLAITSGLWIYKYIWKIF